MTTTKRVTELRVGDKIRLFEGAYGWATVTLVEADTDSGMREVTVQRPYAMVAEHARNRVHLGIEPVMLYGDSNHTYPCEPGSYSPAD